MRLTNSLALSILASCIFSAASLAQAPNFSAALYADGTTWGTKGVTELPTPTVHNRQSFDKLFIIRNSNNPAGQLPVAEAAPRNRMYNGGRWFTHTVDWTTDGFVAHGGVVPVLKSYADLQYQEAMGYVVITQGSFDGGPPLYFECPLLPVKD